MIEARIECLCVGGYHLADLDVTLQQGVVLWMSESKARGSADLRLAERARAVVVRWGERCAASRQPVSVQRQPRIQPVPAEQPPRLKRAVAAPKPLPAPKQEPVSAPKQEPVSAPKETNPPPVVETLNVVRHTKKKNA